MPIRSMTGFAQVRGEIQSQDGGSAAVPAAPGPSNGRLAFALSLKSVNHRFLDLHFRLPSGTDSLEMQLRRLLKEVLGNACNIDCLHCYQSKSGENLLHPPE